MEEWKNKYILLAPIDGKVSFNDFLQINSQVKNNQTICFINPQNTSYAAHIFIPQTNFGKIKVGQNVLLKVNAYPYREFGLIKAKLHFISTIPTDSGFVAKANLPNGLLSTYKKKLHYTEGLKAQAEIITADLKLSDRLFNEIKNILTNK